MTTLIFIENVLGSGQTVKLTEDFGDYSVSRELQPGEHARLVVSPFKAVSVEEIPVSRSKTLTSLDEARRLVGLSAPPMLKRRYG
jgi:hypothetical protein